MFQLPGLSGLHDINHPRQLACVREFGCRVRIRIHIGGQSRNPILDTDTKIHLDGDLIARNYILGYLDPLNDSVVRRLYRTEHVRRREKRAFDLVILIHGISPVLIISVFACGIIMRSVGIRAQAREFIFGEMS